MGCLDEGVAGGDEVSLFSFQHILVGNHLMIILSGDALLVLGIQYDAFLVEVGITLAFVSLEEVDGSLAFLVLWMLVAHWFEKRVEIFLPEPGGIKQDSLYLLVGLPVFQSFAAEDL